MSVRRALALVALTGGLFGVPAAAAADPVTSCTTRMGVLVAVDFRTFGGPIARGCDASITTGLDALHDAGFSTVGTRHDGPAFVCRIDAEPAGDPCVNTPPASAYWSYWHAAPGANSWSYSRTGARDSHPEPGSIDAWVFGRTDVSGSDGGPTFTPQQVRSRTAGAATPTRRPTPPARSTPPRRPTTTGGPPATRRSSSSTGDATTSGSARSSASAATSSTRPATRSAAESSAASNGAPSAASSPASGSASSPPPGRASPIFADATSVADRTPPSSGSAVPLVVTLALVGALLAGASAVAFRRRRVGPDEP